MVQNLQFFLTIEATYWTDMVGHLFWFRYDHELSLYCFALSWFNEVRFSFVLGILLSPLRLWHSPVISLSFLSLLSGIKFFILCIELLLCFGYSPCFWWENLLIPIHFGLFERCLLSFICLDRCLFDINFLDNRILFVKLPLIVTVEGSFLRQVFEISPGVLVRFLLLFGFF